MRNLLGVKDVFDVLLARGRSGGDPGAAGGRAGHHFDGRQHRCLLIRACRPSLSIDPYLPPLTGLATTPRKASKRREYRLGCWAGHHVDCRQHRCLSLHTLEAPQGQMVSLVNLHANTTRIGWHLWEVGLRFAPGLPTGWLPPLTVVGLATTLRGTSKSREYRLVQLRTKHSLENNSDHGTFSQGALVHVSHTSREGNLGSCTTTTLIETVSGSRSVHSCCAARVVA